MGTMKKLAKSGMFGLAGLAATNKDVTNKIARNGGMGIMGMLMAKKKRAAEAGRGMSGRPMMDEDMGSRGAPMMSDMPMRGVGDSSAADRSDNTKEFKKGGKLTDLTGDGKVTRADVLKGRGVPGFKKGSKVSAVEAVRKHERAKHKGQPLTKMSNGGSVSKRADGIATKGKTKGRFV